MKPLHFILILVAVLAVNNLVVLYLLGYLSEPPEEQLLHQAGSQASMPAAESPGNSPAELTTGAPETSADIADDEPAVLESGDGQAPDDAFVSALQRAAKTEVFTDILDEWQMNAGRRYKEAQKQLANMDADELFAAVENSSTRYEKQMALQLLSRGKMDQLESYELKSLYQNPDIGDWNKSQILTALLDKDDPEGLQLAKQYLAEDNPFGYIDHDLINNVYEKDPDFIKRHIDDIDLNQNRRTGNLMSFISSEPDLATDFLNKKFDQMLDSENKYIYQMGFSSPEFEMNRQQQSRVLELFDSNNRYKRNFALNFVQNIENTDELRQAYGTLGRRNEKIRFISGLKAANTSSDHRALAKELAAESDDPQIKQLAK